MQEEEAGHLVVSGSSVCRAFTSGYKFDLKDHYRADMNDSYLLTEVQHVASVGSSYTSAEGGSGEHYSNHFTCIPASVPIPSGAHYAQTLRPRASDGFGRGEVGRRNLGG